MPKAVTFQRLKTKQKNQTKSPSQHIHNHNNKPFHHDKKKLSQQLFLFAMLFLMFSNFISQFPKNPLISWDPLQKCDT